MTAPHPAATRPASPRHLAWLRTELNDWTSSGVITDAQAVQITSRYREQAGAGSGSGSGVTIGRVLLFLGGGFVGIGLIWLVASNLDQLAPTTRFLAVALLWLGFLSGGELLASRSTSRPLVGAIRLIAALAFGAMLFQAAQSLQVPAFEPRLVGLWAAGALLHGYLARAYAPFLVGIVMGVGWWLAQPLWDEPSGLTVVVLLGAGAVLAAGLAVLHDGRLDGFAWTWRLVGGAMALSAMFVAAIPDVGSDDITWSVWLIGSLVAAGVAAVAAVATRRGIGSLEPVGAVATLVVATLLALWQTGADPSDVELADWLHAAVSILAYVLVAVAVVALGTLRDHGALTWIATAALVVFTTFQSFAVFAPIVTGAWLFVVLGTVFLGTGFLVDRGRRRLADALDTATDTFDSEGAVR
ncbi:MAG: DUF2157 domain-containing protein [Nocardioides sp.]|nr:DUF2157 domain-containing protein [Nocardioides sp.]